VPEGDHELHFEARHFKPVVVTGVRRGSTHDVFVEGDSTLRLRVLDEDGQPIDDLWLRAPRSTDLVTPSSSTFPPSSKEGDGWAVFEGLPSRTLQATIHGLDSTLASQRIDDLLPGSTKCLEIDLRQTIGLRGVVLTQAGLPVSGVNIEVRRSPLDASGEVGRRQPLLYVESASTSLNGAWPSVTTTDRNGRFEVRVTDEAHYDVVAFLSPWIYAKATSRSTADAVELRLPAWRSIHGVLVSDTPGFAERIDLEIRSRSDDKTALPSIGPASESFGRGFTIARLIGDSDSFGPLAVPTTFFELLAVLPRSASDFETTSNLSSRPEFPIARFEAGDDDVHGLELSVEHLAPGHIELRFPGQRSHPIDVLLRGTYAHHQVGNDGVEIEWSRRLARPRLILQVTAPLDESPVHIGGIPPGYCTFIISGNLHGARWYEDLEGDYEIGPTSVARLEVELEVVEGSVLCTDAEGEPLRNSPIMVTVQNGKWSTPSLEYTDSRGRLSFSMPPRAFTLSRGAKVDHIKSEPTGPPVEVRWGPDGPDQATVVLTEF
jgi:hypothetical protein